MNHFIEQLVESCNDYDTFKQSDNAWVDLRITEEYATIDLYDKVDVVDWYHGVVQVPYMIWMSPCRPELSNAENHERANAFEEDLKALQYGSMVDGEGQFEYQRIGMTAPFAEEGKERAHMDTFVILGKEAHEEYIEGFMERLARKHGVRFTVRMMLNNGFVDCYEDCSCLNFDAFNLRNNTSCDFAIEDSADFLKTVIMMGFVPRDSAGMATFTVETVSPFTNPKNFTDAQRLAGIAKKFKSEPKVNEPVVA